MEAKKRDLKNLKWILCYQQSFQCRHLQWIWLEVLTIWQHLADAFSQSMRSQNWICLFWFLSCCNWNELRKTGYDRPFIMSKQCRLCAKFTESVIDLFLEHENTLLANINSFLPINVNIHINNINFVIETSRKKCYLFMHIQISKEKGLPSKICCKCVDRSNATHSFIQEVLLAQEVFGIDTSSHMAGGPTNRFELIWFVMGFSLSQHLSFNLIQSSFLFHLHSFSVWCMVALR